MSATEMVDNPQRRVESIGQFHEWLSDCGSEPSSAFIQVSTAVAENLIYGPVIGANADYFRAHDIEPAIALSAMRTLCAATSASSAIYSADLENTRKDLNPIKNRNFKAALFATQTAMANGGSFTFMPTEYAMTAAEGRQQVKLADKLLGKVSPSVQRALAEANYSTYFGKPTMADAEAMLATTIEETLDSTSPD